MTIASEIRKAGPFVGDGITTQFPFSYKVFSASDLYVVQADEEGVELALSLGLNYSVTVNANQNVTPGGSILLAEALPVGHTMVIACRVPTLQPVDLTNQGGFYPRVISDALDRLTIIAQQLAEVAGRSMVFPMNDSATSMGLLPPASVRANKILVFDGTGKPVEGSISAAIATIESIAVVKIFIAGGVSIDLDGFSNVICGKSDGSADPVTLSDSRGYTIMELPTYELWGKLETVSLTLEEVGGVKTWVTI